LRLVAGGSQLAAELPYRNWCIRRPSEPGLAWSSRTGELQIGLLAASTILPRRQLQAASRKLPAAGQC